MIEETLPCGKKIIENDGIKYIKVRENTLMRKDQYCMVCHRIDEIETSLKTDNISVGDKIDLIKELEDLKSIIPDYSGKHPECKFQISFATKNDFDIAKIYIDDIRDIKTMTDFVQKYGFNALVLFLSYYANQSKLGVEWFELMMRESALQSKRLVLNPNCADESSPMYKPAMLLAGSLSRTLDESKDKYDAGIYG